MDKKAKDFIFSFVLMAVAVYVFVGGMHIYFEAASMPYNITEFTISPAFLPVILGAALFFCAILLCLQSLSGTERKGKAAKAYWGQFKASLKPLFANKNFLSMVGGACIIFIYTFILVGLIPYWAASFVFLVALMLFLQATKPVRVIIISAVVVGLILLLFKVAFRAALP